MTITWAERHIEALERENRELKQRIAELEGQAETSPAIEADDSVHPIRSNAIRPGCFE